MEPGCAVRRSFVCIAVVMNSQAQECGTDGEWRRHCDEVDRSQLD